MKSKFTNFYIKISLYLAVFVGLSASSAFAQGFGGGKTYVVNGQIDQVAPVDTFVNLSGAGTAGAITYLNTFGIDVTQPLGTVTILLDQGYSGIEPSVIQVGATNGSGYPNMSATRPVVLRPKAGLNFVISTTALIGTNGSLFRIFGSTDFSIDGAGTPGERNITFQMGASTTASAKVIDIIPALAASSNRIRNVSIRNCVIVGNSTPTAINTFAGIYFGGAAATPSNALLGTNYNISYTNNLIMAVQNGIYHRGFPTNATAFPSQDTGVNIINNIIGDYTNPINAANSASIGGVNATPASGIYLQTAANSTISGNIIRNTLRLSIPNVNNGFAGIRLATDGNQIALDSNIRIVKNQIYNLYTNQTTGGIFGIRISLGSHNTTRRLLVANNSISRIASVSGGTTITNAGTYTAGVFVENATSYVGLEMLFNSINLVGDTMGSNNGASTVSACLLTGSATTGGIRLLNNSFSNRMGGTSTNVAGYQNYVIVVTANNVNPFSYSNFNNYYANTFGSGYAFVAGLVRGGLVRNISTLKNYRLYSLSDSNSFGIIPPFTNDTVLTIANGVSNRLYNRGYALNTLNLFSRAISDSVINKVTDDILGNPRTGLGRFTSVGCHQWLGDSTNLPSPLIGGVTYNIDGGISNPPKIGSPNGSFKDLAEAIAYLNSYGISGNQNNITLRITSTYPRETTWIPAIVDYPGSDASLSVVIRPDVGVVDTIWAPNVVNAANSSVLRFMGARNVIVDGLTNTDKNVRNLTFMFRNASVTPNSRVISITPSDTSCQNITIRNVNILGNTTTTAINTFAGIYYGFPFLSSATPNQNDTLRSVANSNITITGNLIQGVRNGIHVRGSGANPGGTAPAFAATAPGTPTNRITNLRISNNIIGGTIAPNGTVPTTFIGGATTQAGIYVNGVEAALIDSNVVRNCLPTASVSDGFRGIEINELQGANPYPNWDVTVTKNFIYNLTTLTGASCIGIRAQMSAPSGARSYFFANNHISNILSRGVTNSPINVSNPTGIFIDANVANTATNVVTLVNNTINMSGNNILNTSAGITALYLGGNIRGGISSVNNIYGVTANRNNAGNMYAVTVLSATSPFAPNASLFVPASDFNSYFVSGNNPTLANNILMVTPSAVPATRTNINAIRAFMGTNVDMSSFNFPTRFVSDTLPDLLAVTAGTRYTSGASVSVILTDIYGASRAAGSNLGAVNFVTLNAPLQPNATYQISGSDNFPLLANPTSGSFRTLRSAVNYLNAFGVGLSFTGVQPVRLELANGYQGETDTFVTPITVLDYPFANASVPVVVSVASGRQDTIRFTNVITTPAANSSLIRITSGRFFGFDGSNNNTNSRDLTIVMPAIMNSNTFKIIDLLGGQSSIFSANLATSNNFVRNCNLIGNSTTTGINTFAAIYSGGITATPSNSLGTGGNNNNEFSNNFIGGCQYGIYLRSNGVRGQGDNNNIISGNIIGGNIAPGGSLATDYFGGVNNAAGIFCVGQYLANISRNRIQNNIVTFNNPRGIELATIVGSNTVLDSANIIDGNIIRNITSTVAASTAYGIYMNFGADAGNITNSSSIRNNMISGIAAQGTTALMGGVYGIAIDGTANITDANIGIHFNSVNLGTANTLATGSRSACLAIAAPFRLDAASIALNYGFKMTNNLFSNKLGGAPASTNVTSRAVIIGNLLSPFNLSDYNNYFCNATNATNGLVMANAISTTPTTYTTWDSIYRFTGGDLFSSNLTAPFTSDLDLFIPASANSVIYNAGNPVTGITGDVVGNARNIFTPTIGAHEYAGGTFIDSILPRILPANPINCVSSIFNTVTFIVEDKNFTGDVFTYRVNGGTPVNVPANIPYTTTSAGYRQISYTLPSSVLAAGGLIEYKITAQDISGNIGVYPTDKPWEVLSTGLATFPYTMNFENGNEGWTAQSLTNGANWNTSAFGSASNPTQATESGIRCALFPSSTLPAGASARLISPCLNLSVLSRPMLRFRFSQSNNLVGRRDSVSVKIMQNGFIGSDEKIVIRPNTSSPFPDWFTVEVCLSLYRSPGNTYNVVFDAFSTGGGQNMMIDSIQIFDDIQNQVVTPQTATICNTSQPFTVTIPNSDPRYVYRALHLENGGGVSVLDTAFGNNGSLTLNFANRQVDTINYVISAINYGSATYVPPFSSTTPNICSNNLPGTFRTVINRFTRPITSEGGYIIPDLTTGAFNGSANDGDQFKPDAVKFGNKLTYKILTPTSYYTNASYNTAWTLLNTSLRTLNSGTPATNFTFTPPTASADAKVEFTPTAAEGDSVFILSTTLRFLGTNCDTVVTRYIKVNNPVAYNFITGPRADTACTGTGLNFLINQGSLFGTTQLWEFGDNTISTFAVPQPKVWNTPGVYRVKLTVTSALGISDTVSRLIYVLQAPSAAYTASSVAIVCQNDSTFFNVSNPAPGLSYLWNFPGNISRTSANTSFAFGKADTNYTVSLRVTNPANACFAVNSRVFPSYAKPKAKFTVTSHCQGQFMPYTDSSSISNGDRLGYFWTFSTGETRVSNGFQIRFANSGNVRVSLRLTSAAGCVDTTSQLVTVYETPQAGFISGAACTNDSTTFTNQTVYGPGIQNASYVWDFGDNSGTDTRQDPKHRYLNNNSGDPFKVTLIATNKLFGCSSTFSDDVIVNIAPVAVAELGGTIKTGISSDKVCVGNNVTFTSKSFSSSGGTINCDWVFGNGQSGACNTFNVYPDPGVYTWSLTATANGCRDTKEGTITVVPKPVITFTNQHFAIPASRFTTNNRQVFTPSDLVTDGNSYSWNFGDADSTTSTQRIAEFTYNKKDTYEVRMKVTTADGCVVNFTDTVIVDVSVSAGEELAAKFDLVAYPNPLTNNAFVSLSLTKSDDISIVITDVLGREISTTNYTKVSAGKHNFELTSNNFTAAGTYFVKVKIGDETVVKSLVKQ